MPNRGSTPNSDSNSESELASTADRDEESFEPPTEGPDRESGADEELDADEEPGSESDREFNWEADQDSQWFEE